MKDDYETESQRRTYTNGIVSSISGHARVDNPHRKRMFEVLKLYTAWNAGYDETASIAEKSK